MNSMQMQAMKNKYFESQVMTATPEQLLIMLYDGAIRFCKLGIESIKEKRYEEANKYLIRVQDIISELMITLDREAPTSASLLQLYEYFNHRLITANMSKTVEPAEEVLEHLQTLRETWTEAALQMKKQTKPQLTVGTGGVVSG